MPLRKGDLLFIHAYPVENSAAAAYVEVAAKSSAITTYADYVL